MRFFFKKADIEDIAKPVPRLENPRPTIQVVQETKPVLRMEDCPKPEENFGSWLKHQKSNWRNIRQKMRTEKKTLAQHGSIFVKNPVGT